VQRGRDRKESKAATSYPPYQPSAATGSRYPRVGGGINKTVDFLGKGRARRGAGQVALFAGKSSNHSDTAGLERAKD
jgi:hypothetical protein